MTTFTDRLTKAFGGPVFRAIAEVGPFDSFVRLDIISEDGDDVQAMMFPDIGRGIPVDTKKIVEIPKQWTVTCSDGRVFYWRPISPEQAQAFTDYMGSY